MGVDGQLDLSRRRATHARSQIAALAGVVGLIGVVIPAASAIADEGEDPLECTSEALSLEDAAEIAVLCGYDVEAIDERTEWDTVYATQAGTVVLETSVAAVRTAVSGEWGEIDNTVVATSEGLGVVAPVVPMVFSSGGDRALVTMSRGGHVVTMESPFDLTVPVVDGAVIEYPGVLPGVDLVVTVNDDATGFSQVFRVATPEAALDPRLAELDFPVEASGGLDLVASDGGFDAVDGAGEVVFRSPTPLMWDSAADDTVIQAPFGAPPLLGDPDDARDGRSWDRAEAPYEGDTVVAMDSELAEGTLTVRPDPELLTGEDTVWPVYIDPSISANRHEWTAVRNNFGPDFKFSADQGLGLCHLPTAAACNTTFRSRLVWEFNGLGTIGSLASADIVNATFSAWGTHSYDCNNRAVEAFRLDLISSSSTWSNTGPWVPDRRQGSRSVAHKSSCSGKAPRWIDFDVSQAARWIASQSSSSVAIGLKANETAMLGWKRYRYDAKLSVEYNRAPNTPTSVRTTGPVSTCGIGGARPVINDPRPTLRAVLSDPDGGTLRGDFEVSDLSGPSPVSVWQPALTAAAASGSEHTRRVPAGVMTTNRVYRWQIRAQDPQGRTSALVRCEFLVDLTPPNRPGVAPVAGQPAVYVEDHASGGVGVRGQFRFTNGGSSDVVSYQYSVNNDSYGQSVSGSSATVNYTPGTPGLHTLYVRSVDRAGWTSPARVYHFGVAPPAVDGLWRFDEGSGTTVADSGPGGNVNPLTVASGAQWVPGPFADFGVDPDDTALQLGPPGGSASAAGRVAATAQSFTVMAHVRLDSTATTAAALSQDGTVTNGFTLGYRTDSACPTGTGGECWGFWMSPTDSASATPVKALSAVPVRTGEWVHLAGVHDAAAGLLTLYICELGTPQDPAPAEPVAGAPATLVSPWDATGTFQVGRARTGATYTAHWTGAVDNATVLHGAAAVDDVRMSCQGG